MSTHATASPARPSSRSAGHFCLRVSGTLPVHGSRILIQTDACRLTSAEIKRAQRQLQEALAGAAQLRLGSPRLTLLTAEGRPLRQTALVEQPGGGGYLAAELTPGGSAGQTALWLAGCAREFGRKRTL